MSTFLRRILLPHYLFSILALVLLLNNPAGATSRFFAGTSVLTAAGLAQATPTLHDALQQAVDKAILNIHAPDYHNHDHEHGCTYIDVYTSRLFGQKVSIAAPPSGFELSFSGEKQMRLRTKAYVSVAVPIHAHLGVHVHIPFVGNRCWFNEDVCTTSEPATLSFVAEIDALIDVETTDGVVSLVLNPVGGSGGDPVVVPNPQVQGCHPSGGWIARQFWKVVGGGGDFHADIVAAVTAGIDAFLAAIGGHGMTLPAVVALTDTIFLEYQMSELNITAPSHATAGFWTEVIFTTPDGVNRTADVEALPFSCHPPSTWNASDPSPFIAPSTEGGIPVPVVNVRASTQLVSVLFQVMRDQDRFNTTNAIQVFDNNMTLALDFGNPTVIVRGTAVTKTVEIDFPSGSLLLSCADHRACNDGIMIQSDFAHARFKGNVLTTDNGTALSVDVLDMLTEDMTFHLHRPKSWQFLEIFGVPFLHAKRKTIVGDINDALSPFVIPPVVTNVTTNTAVDVVPMPMCVLPNHGYGRLTGYCQCGVSDPALRCNDLVECPTHRAPELSSDAGVRANGSVVTLNLFLQSDSCSTGSYPANASMPVSSTAETHVLTLDGSCHQANPDSTVGAYVGVADGKTVSLSFGCALFPGERDCQLCTVSTATFLIDTCSSPPELEGSLVRSLSVADNDLGRLCNNLWYQPTDFLLSLTTPGNGSNQTCSPTDPMDVSSFLPLPPATGECVLLSGTNNSFAQLSPAGQLRFACGNSSCDNCQYETDTRSCVGPTNSTRETAARVVNPGHLGSCGPVPPAALPIKQPSPVPPIFPALVAIAVIFVVVPGTLFSWRPVVRATKEWLNSWILVVPSFHNSDHFSNTDRVLFTSGAVASLSAACVSAVSFWNDVYFGELSSILHHQLHFSAAQLDIKRVQHRYTQLSNVSAVVSTTVVACLIFVLVLPFCVRSPTGQPLRWPRSTFAWISALFAVCSFVAIAAVSILVYPVDEGVKFVNETVDSSVPLHKLELAVSFAILQSVAMYCFSLIVYVTRGFIAGWVAVHMLVHRMLPFAVEASLSADFLLVLLAFAAFCIDLVPVVLVKEIITDESWMILALSFWPVLLLGIFVSARTHHAHAAVRLLTGSVALILVAIPVAMVNTGTKPPLMTSGPANRILVTFGLFGAGLCLMALALRVVSDAQGLQPCNAPLLRNDDGRQIVAAVPEFFVFVPLVEPSCNAFLAYAVVVGWPGRLLLRSLHRSHHRHRNAQAFACTLRLHPLDCHRAHDSLCCHLRDRHRRPLGPHQDAVLCAEHHCRRLPLHCRPRGLPHGDCLACRQGPRAQCQRPHRRSGNSMTSKHHDFVTCDGLKLVHHITRVN